MNDWLRVDTHVHLHDCFEYGAFLDAAAENLRAGTNPDRLHAAICLTEIQGTDRFSEFAESARDGRLGNSEWSVSRTDELNSLLLMHTNGFVLAVIAGRQIQCKEGLEVLALGRVAEIPDGRPIREVIDTVSADGEIPVIPWGFLKWTGARGRLVAALLQSTCLETLFGDNGARLAGTPTPKLLQKAEQSKRRVLPGTDPFPFKWDTYRVGSYGLRCRGHLTARIPYSDLKAKLYDPEFSAESFGRRLGLVPFVRNQVAIQLRKRLRARVL